MRSYVHIVTVLFLFCLDGSASSAALYGRQNEEELSSHVFHLPYCEDGIFLYKNFSLKGLETAFKKEPDFGKNRIIRSAIPTGKKKRDYLGFAVDITSGKLYLDLNRNLDLTDDQSGVFNYSSMSKRHVVFSTISIEIAHGNVSHPYVFDLQIIRRLRPSYCTVIVRSGWQGVIELYGKSWRLTIADNMDGILGRGDMVMLRDSKEAPVKQAVFGRRDFLPVMKNLFFGGHEYDLTYDFEPKEIRGPMGVTFSEKRPPMGELTIDGHFIKRLILVPGYRNDPQVILDYPGEVVSIPARKYVRQQVYLDNEDSLGCYHSQLSKIIVVSESKSAALKIGGPLINKVSMNPHGPRLDLSYSLVGRGNESYGTITSNTSAPPQFVVYRGDDKIATGPFRYG